MIYTSYFSNVKKILETRPNMRFCSIAGKTPDWLLELDSNNKLKAFKCSSLMPKYTWWKEWHDKFEDSLESEASKAWYVDKYNETVLAALDPQEIIDKLYSLSEGNDICLLCYETPEKFCHRHIVSDWLNDSGIECKEFMSDCKVTKDKIIKIMHFDSHSKKRLFVNDNYVCEFTVPNSLEDWQTYSFFSEWFKETSCPRMSCYADVIAYDYSKFKKFRGRIYLHIDEDLNDRYSMELFICSDSENEFKTMIPIVNVEIEELPISVSEFMKLIDYKPLSEIKEPYDSCGLTVCEFKEHNKMFPNIEFGMDGKLYYEIVDETNYKQGSVIPLNSPLRKDVISYEPLTKDTAKNLADRINASLKKLYES